VEEKNAYISSCNLSNRCSISMVLAEILSIKWQNSSFLISHLAEVTQLTNRTVSLTIQRCQLLCQVLLLSDRKQCVRNSTSEIQHKRTHESNYNIMFSLSFQVYIINLKRQRRRNEFYTNDR